MYYKTRDMDHVSRSLLNYIVINHYLRKNYFSIKYFSRIIYPNVKYYLYINLA